MLEKYVKRTNFWENLTPLDSSHLEVFLGIFGEFFIFLIQIWILNLVRFGTGPNRNRAGPVWPVTGQTGPVPTGLVNPGLMMFVASIWWTSFEEVVFFPWLGSIGCIIQKWKQQHCEKKFSQIHGMYVGMKVDKEKVCNGWRECKCFRMSTCFL